MEKSSRALQHLDLKIWFSFKVWNSNFDLYFDLSWRAEITLASLISVLHRKLVHQWKCLLEYCSMETPKFELFSKNSKFEFWLVTKSCTYMMTLGMHRRPFEGGHLVDTSMERSSQVLQYVNPKNLIFFSKKVKIDIWLVFWLVLKSWNRPNFVNISPTLVIDTSMERSSRVATTAWKPIFFKRSKLNFDLYLTYAEVLKSPYSFVNISLTIVIDKFYFEKRCFLNCILTYAELLPITLASFFNLILCKLHMIQVLDEVYRGFERNRFNIFRMYETLISLSNIQFWSQVIVFVPLPLLLFVINFLTSLWCSQKASSDQMLDR